MRKIRFYIENIVCNGYSSSTTWSHLVMAILGCQHLELIRITGHTCGGFLANWIIWGRKTHLKSRSLEYGKTYPKSGPQLFLAAYTKDKDGRSFCLWLLALSLISLALEPASLEFQHKLKASWDVQLHRLNNHCVLGLSIGKEPLLD